MRPKRKRKDQPSSIWWDQFGLKSDPFALTPDPDFFFQSEVHAEALAGLKLGLLQQRGLIVLSGEVGTGKTTVVYSLLSSLDEAIETAYVSNTSLPFEEMLEQVLSDLGVSCAGPRRVDLLAALNEHLNSCARNGKSVALVIDEAQNLSDDAFENVRLLLNFETYRSKLLQIVLVGQPELETRLRSHRLRQIADRVAIYCHLQPLSSKDTRRYIEHRLQAAGGSSRIFTRLALSAVVRRSRGFPRRINITCHNAMLFAFGQKRSRIGVSLVGAGSSELDKRGLLRRRLRTVVVLVVLGVAATIAGVSQAPRWWTPAGVEDPLPIVVPVQNDQVPDQAEKPLEEDGVTAPTQTARTITVAPGQTITSIMLEAYGSVEGPLLRQVLQANPQVENPDVIAPGSVLQLPDIGLPAVAEAMPVRDSP